MKYLIITSILGATLILGCGIPMVQTSWSKPGAQPGEFERDSTFCDQDPGQMGMGAAAAYDVCMQRRGWFLVEEPVK